MFSGYLWLLAIRRGMSKEKVMEVCSAAIQPAGIILLVTGAGGVFKQVLVDSGVRASIENALIGAGMPIAVACLFLQVLYVLFKALRLWLV